LLGLIAAPALAQTVHPDSLEQREGLYYKKGSAAPYTGAVEDPGVMVGQVEDGLRVGPWKGWHANGELNFVFEHEGGQLVHRTIWHANGAKRMEGRFVDGRPEGVHPRWDENGQQVSEETYRAGNLHGARRLWDPDGHLLHEAHYEDGALHGPSVWYYADGAKRWETHYDAGQRTGTWTQWAGNGDLFMQSEWEGGRFVRRHNPHAHH
jgi:antitoxin component YwqK of YwqJK toxin-antitoxin module